MTRLEDIQRFYALLNDLELRVGGSRKLRDCDGRMAWPARGIYFFFESGEQRTDSGAGSRVVRVGTHALKAGSGTSLWNRLSQHRGPLKSGGGNHRGSIFRLIVGAALIRREGWECKSWGVGSHSRQAAERLGISQDDLQAMELPIERSVSEYIGSMPFLWLAVNDEPGPESLRGYLERNAIALLSNHSRTPIDQAGDSWLGQHSGRDRIRLSGLWNNNHVQEECDPSFLGTLEEAIE